MCLIRDVYKGGRVQIVNGCPGAAKTDLMCVASIWIYTFTDLRIGFVNQQNNSNAATIKCFLSMCVRVNGHHSLLFLSEPFK
eukprot:15224041-Heterocapsa_arctica.AAC.1